MHNYGVVLAHSAKGSEWENHKYIRKKNGTYYYLDENGHETTTTHKSESSKSDTTSTDKNVSAEAKKLIDSNIKSEDLTDENVVKHDGLYDCGSYLVHFGNKNSGRYPRGSGERPHQHDGLGSKGRDVRPYEADSYNPKKIGPHRKSEEQKSYSKQKRHETADKLLDQNIKGGKDKPNISYAEKTIKDVDRTIDSTKRIRSDVKDIKKRKQYMKEAEKMSKMSDEELKKVVNRANLEKQYLNAVDYTTLDDGGRKIDDILDITGDVVGIVGGVVSIAVGIHMLRK